ncbi:hypothetical protein ABH926_004877 [Catenulispora sp. GP43]|uniref:hypothetical protein n=1 Tax=Catenulispora sp. GP43 TaxID=3156263 RepID=UPI003516E26E
MDRVRLARVRDEVGESTMRRFIATYLDLLQPRLKRIVQPRESGRADGLRAAYDLRVASEMLGAGRLAGLVAGIEQAYRDGRAAGSRPIAALRREADAVAEDLAGVLRDHAA